MKDVFSEEIDKALSNNYAGEEENYAGDEYNNFSGRADGSPLQFDITIINTSGQDLNVVLNPGFIDTTRVPKLEVSNGAHLVRMPGGGMVARSFLDSITNDQGPAIILNDNPEKLAKYLGKPVHAVIGDGGKNNTGIVYVATANNPDMSDFKGLKVVTTEGTYVEQLLRFVKNNPVKVAQILVDVNNKLVYSGKSITRQVVSPFGPTAPSFIKFNDYFSEKQQQDLRLTMDLKAKNHFLQFDDQSVIMVSIPGTVNGQSYVEMTMQFNFDKVVNNAAKAFKAIRKGKK